MSALPPRPLSILVVHPEVPPHDRNSGALRLRRLLELMVADGHRVTFVALAGFGGERYAEELRDLGIEVHEFDARRLRARGAAVPGPGIDVPGLLRRGRFDVAWLGFLQAAVHYLPEIREHSPATRIIVDTFDVQYVRERRGAEVSGDPALLAAAERMRRAEAACYGAADAVVAVSEEDARALRELVPEVPVAIVSNVHAEVGPGPGFAARSGLVFVGSFDHVPNVDAMVHFHATTWPLVRAAVPDATLAIVGQNPPPEVQALAGGGVTVTGWVPEVVPYLDAARVSIAPLRFGAGVKGKIGEAMSHGLPVVTTPVGAEGMGLADGVNAMVASEPRDLAEAIVRVHDDRELWVSVSAAGRAHVNAQLSPEVARDALRALLRSVVRPCLVGDVEWAGGDVRPVLAEYLARFAPGADASLLLPVDTTRVAVEQAFAEIEAALADLGADPEAIPDVVVHPCEGGVPVPAGAERLGREQPSGEGRPLASIVICCYGKRDYTERCLESLERALGPRLGTEVEVVVVDNASPDDTLALLDAWSDRVRVLALPENRNFAGGNNAGAAIARGRALVFLNNDTEVGLGAIDAVVSEALEPGVGLAGARLVYPDGRIQHGGFALRPSPRGGAGVIPFHLFQYEDGEIEPARASFDLGFVTGACMAIEAGFFADLGGWDEGYINGWEDVDLCLRVRATGARVRLRGDAAIVHHEGISTGGTYDPAGNGRRFAEKWSAALAPDDALVRRTFGARWSDDVDVPRPDDAADGAPVCVVGPALGLGADGAEARGLLRALARTDVAAWTPAPSWLQPDLSDAAPVARAHARSARPDATTIVLPDASTAAEPVRGTRILRLAEVPAERPGGAQAWAASPRVATGLIDAGWPAEAVAVVPPCGIDVPLGEGGDGVLAVLPDHDLDAAGAVLDLLAARPGERIRVVPTVRTREVAALVRARVPGAELLEPVTDETAWARLCATADLVIANDPSDRFDRRALVAAGTGAAVVCRAAGPAAAVLGGTSTREERHALVREACGPAASARALELLGLAVDHHAAGIEAFSRGDVGGARAALESAVAAAGEPGAELLNDLAVVCHAAGDLGRAQELLRACLAVDPHHAEARENLGALAA